MGQRDKKRKQATVTATASFPEEAQTNQKVMNESPGEIQNWILKLAKNNVDVTAAVAPPKEERKAKRAAKQARRQQRLDQKQQAHGHTESAEKPKSTPSASRLEIVSNQKRLRTLIEEISAVVENVKEKNNHNKWPKPYEGANNKILHKKRQWDDSGIQPRPRDYGGIGLARPSLFVPFEESSWVPKLEEEFAEHIPGFFGKQRTKAMKKQLNANMLWKRMLNDKSNKKKTKTAGKMSADERVEAMLKAGML